MPAVYLPVMPVLSRHREGWWNSSSTFKYPYVFASYLTHKTFRKLRREFMVDDDVVLFSDSGGFCLPPNELVYTDKGVKPISDVAVGDKVLAHDGIMQTVLRKSARPYSGLVITVRPKWLRLPFTVTPNHPIFVAQVEYCHKIASYCLPQRKRILNVCAKCSEIPTVTYGWIEAGKLDNKKYFLVYPIINEVVDVESIDLLEYVKYNPRYYKVSDDAVKSHRAPSSVKRWVRVDDKFLRLAGYYVAEGHLDKSTGYIWLSLNKDEHAMIDDIVEGFDRCFNIEAKVHEDRRSNGVEIEVCSRIVSDFFVSLFGTGAYNKHVPEFFLKLPTDKQRIFLFAYALGDGSLFHDGQDLEIGTVSPTLCFQVVQMLLRSGLKPSVTVSESYSPYGHRVKDCYSIYFNNRTGYRHKYTIMGDKLLLPFDIECKMYDGFVYNLDVSGSKSYTLMSAAVHNSTFSRGMSVDPHSLAEWYNSSGVDLAIHLDFPPYTDARKSKVVEFEERLELTARCSKILLDNVKSSVKLYATIHGNNEKHYDIWRSAMELVSDDWFGWAVGVAPVNDPDAVLRLVRYLESFKNEKPVHFFECGSAEAFILIARYANKRELFITADSTYASTAAQSGMLYMTVFGKLVPIGPRQEDSLKNKLSCLCPVCSRYGELREDTELLTLHNTFMLVWRYSFLNSISTEKPEAIKKLLPEAVPYIRQLDAILGKRGGLLDYV